MVPFAVDGFRVPGGGFNIDIFEKLLLLLLLLLLLVLVLEVL